MGIIIVYYGEPRLVIWASNINPFLKEVYLECICEHHRLKTFGQALELIGGAGISQVG